jgi:opacity protein-like surface antigen
VKGLITRLYYDNSPSDNPVKPATQQLFSVFSGYRLPKVFRIGAEYNYHLNHANVKNNDLFGLSVYGSYEMTERFEIFARYDNLQSNTLNGASDPWHYTEDGQAYIAGVHYVPVKNIALSLSYQGWQPADRTFKFKNTGAFSFEYKL